MDEQKTQESPASEADKAGMPAWGWIAIIVLVAAVVALLMLKQQPQPLNELDRSVPGETGSMPGGTPSVGAPTGSTQVPAGSGAAAQPASQPINFDAELKGLDTEANSVSENNFDENDLSDANVGI